MKNFGLVILMALALVFAGCSSGADTYSVAYDGNGNTAGTVPVDADKYAEGATVSALCNWGGLAKTGFVFSGWNTVADGSGDAYASGSGTFFMPAQNVTLYASWKAAEATYTVTYDGNGNTSGSVPVDATAYRVGDTVTAQANWNALAKTGFYFSGWNTQADGSGTAFATGVGVFGMPANNVTLYAMWTQTASYIVTYTVDGGATAYSSAIVLSGSTVGTLPAEPVKDGYSFGGWYTGLNGTGSVFTAQVSVTAGLTVYAKWTASARAITFKANGGSGADYTQTAASGATVTLTAATFTRNGCDFCGWSLTADGLGANYADEAAFALGSADVTLYAIWGSKNLTYYRLGSVASQRAIAIGSESTGYTVRATSTAISGALVIPAVYKGTPVTAIDSDGFAECDKITSVSLPKSLVSIGENAFLKCVKLASVVIPDSVEMLDGYAFYDCVKLRSVDLSDSLLAIPSYAFAGCTALTAVDLPASLTELGEGAFYACSALASVSGGSGLEEIGSGCFGACEAITSLTLGSSVSVIGTVALDCPNLTTLTVLATTPPTVTGGVLGKFRLENLIVPASADDSVITAYQTTVPWSTYSSLTKELAN
jgi:uncharacterized repeat protein (TIGR02543 family)